MDLAQDILRIGEKVAQVPGLGAAFSLTMTIIKTVQISKNNTARLQYLAHSVAEHLVAIAEHMEGKWDNAPDSLKRQIDEFEGVLGEISKLVTKYSKSSQVVAFLNAGDRDMVIQRMERRLADAKTSVLMLLEVDASLSLHNIETAVNSHALQAQLERLAVRNKIEDTYSKVLDIEDGIHGHTALSSYPRVENTDVRVYTREDLQILETISRSYEWSSDNRHRLTGALKKARHRTNKQVVLVRTYEDSDLNERTKTFLCDLSSYTNLWESHILQLVGASGSGSHIPFQVYDAPDGQVESFGDWLLRTAKSHPVETIFGLYEMRISVKALLEFQTSRGIQGPLFFDDSVVNVQTSGNRHQWVLIYTGEITNYRTPLTVNDEYGNLHHWTDIAPSWEVAESFTRQSRSWVDGAPVLDAFLDQGIQNVDLATLLSALVKNGWLGTSHDHLPPSTTVGLGDVGYTTEDHCFITIANLHSLLSSVDGSALTWDLESYQSPTPEDTAVMEYLGESYKRYKHQSSSFHRYTLGYTNLNEGHAWKVLQGCAYNISMSHAPATSPYNLKLVTSIKKWECFNLKPSYYSEVKEAKLDEDPDLGEDTLSAGTKTQGADNTAMDSGSNTFDWHSSHDPSPLQLIPQPPSPPFYVFKGNALSVRASGEPEFFPCVRASFQAEPDWLGDNDPFRADKVQERYQRTMVGKKDGYDLSESQHCMIDYLQLPEGVSLPHVEEVCDP